MFGCWAALPAAIIIFIRMEYNIFLMVTPELLVFGPDPIVMAITILAVFFVGFITGIWVGRKHIFVEIPKEAIKHGK